MTQCSGFLTDWCDHIPRFAQYGPTKARYGRRRDSRRSIGVVNVVVTKGAGPLRALALSYAPQERRAGMAALFELDQMLGRILRTTTQPMVGQMRLAWWREALAGLDVTPSPAEPVLDVVAREVLPLGITGVTLSRMADGWEVLLGEIDDYALTSYARDRGGVLFEQAGIAIGAGPGDPLAAAGRGWALTDLAANIGDAKVAEQARLKARDAFAGMGHGRWSRPGRALGALALAARLELEGPPRPWWVARIAWHRISGR